MKFRIGLIITFLIAGFSFLNTDHCIIAYLFFGFTLVVFMEVIVVRRYYHLRGFRLGRASEFSLMTTEDNRNLEIVTIPILLKFPYFYTLKAFRVRLIANGIRIASEVYTTSGDCFGEGIGTVFTLDWDNRKGFIAIAHLAGKQVMVGTPIISKPIGQEGKYRVVIEVYRNNKVLASQSYILFYQDTLQLLED